MSKILSTLLVFFLSSNVLLFSQTDIKEILSTARNFDQAVEQAEDFFKTKYPNLTPKELCEGEHRDGEYVKYSRWRAYWEDRLNPDGTLGDPSAYFRNTEGSDRGSGPFDGIEWTNISYENFITGQINMGRTTCVAFHPTDANTFFVGGAIGGVWKTTDGGNSYVPIGDELPFLSVSAIVVNQDNPDEIYIAISDHVWYGPPSIGIYKSTDGGTTWSSTSLSFEFTEGVRVYWMIADPTDADRVFVATDDGLFLTEDGFETNSLITTASSFDLKFKPDDASIVYLGTTNGSLYRSINGGNNFSLIQNLGGSSCLIAVTPLNPEKCYIRIGGNMFKSIDAGLTFSGGISTPDSGGQLIFSPSDENTLVGGSFDIHKTSNNGDSFDAVSHWLGDEGLPLIHVDQRNVFTNPLQNDVVYFCNDGGLYTLNPETENFVDLSDGLLITQFYDIAVSQSDPNVVGGGSQDNGNVSRNSDGEWFEYAFTGDGMNQEIDPTDADVRYWSYQYGSMHRWESGSNTNISPPNQNGEGAWETPYKLDYSSPDRMICAYDKIYESFDRGSSWYVIGDDFGDSDFSQLAIAPSLPARIYAIQGFEMKINDIFTNEWYSESIPHSNISDIAVDPIDMEVIYLTRAGYSDGNKVYKTINAGANWENISGSLPNVSTGSIETYDVVAGGLFVGTDAGVFYIDNTLEDWVPYGDLPNTRVEDIEIQYSNGLIRVGTHGRGMIEAPVSIGICNGENDLDNDGICDEYDQCPDFDDTLLGSPCDDGDSETVSDIYTDCGICAGYLFVGIDDLPENSVVLYPNPSSGILNIQMEGINDGVFHLFNLSGQLVAKEQIVQGNNELDLTQLAAGSYIAKVFLEGRPVHSEVLMLE